MTDIFKQLKNIVKKNSSQMAMDTRIQRLSQNINNTVKKIESLISK